MGEHGEGDVRSEPPTPLDGPLPPGASRETKIRRDAQGRWFDGGVPITHPKLARAFDGWVSRAPDGRYCLSNDIHWVYVEIEGPPYFVDILHEAGADLILGLSGGSQARLDPSTLYIGHDDSIYCRVFALGLPARFRNAAAIRLSDYLEQSSAGLRFTRGAVSHILAHVVEPT